MPTLPAVSADALLVTPEEVEDAALASLALDVSGGAGTDDYDQTTLALADAEALVDAYLDRTLFAHVETVPVGPYLFERDRGDATGTVGARIPAWPFVEVDASSGVTVADHGLAADPADAARVTVTTRPTVGLALVYVAGYRGRQHTLDGAASTTDITGLSGLSGLTTLPPEVPADVRRTIVELTLLFLNRARQRSLGTGSVVQQIGERSVTIERADVDAEARILARLAPHRRLA